MVKSLKDGKALNPKENKSQAIKPISKYSQYNMKSVSAPPANFSVIVEGEESVGFLQMYFYLILYPRYPFSSSTYRKYCKYIIDRYTGYFSKLTWLSKNIILEHIIYTSFNSSFENVSDLFYLLSYMNLKLRLKNNP